MFLRIPYGYVWDLEGEMQSSSHICSTFGRLVAEHKTVCNSNNILTNLLAYLVPVGRQLCLQSLQLSPDHPSLSLNPGPGVRLALWKSGPTASARHRHWRWGLGRGEENKGSNLKVGFQLIFVGWKLFLLLLTPHLYSLSEYWLCTRCEENNFL